MKKTILILFLLIAFLNAVFADRGRIQMAHGTVVTDTGSNLRGAILSVDLNNTLPANCKQKILACPTTYGLNTIHLYLEKYDTPTGLNSKLADSIVNWTSQANMYLVITIGCGSKNGTFDLTQSKAFWNFYAGRYANRTHVIYEIHNEPENECDNAQSAATIDMEYQCYSIIRTKAPDTHIMVFSNSAVAKATVIKADINAMKAKGASFANMSIAYHGYYWCAGARDGAGYPNNTEALCLDPIIKAGYSLVCTEFDRDNTLTGDITKNGQLLKFYEQRNVSWLCFFDIATGASTALNSAWKTGVNNMGLTWIPDFGNWPLNAVSSDFELQNGRKDDMVVFPNPATSCVTIFFPEFTDNELIITDLSGNTILSAKTSGNSFDLDTSNFTKGIYIVSILNSEKRLNKKLIIQ